MVKLYWNYGEPPKDMQVRQVYGIAFDDSGRVLIKADKRGDKYVYGMFGGKPEITDKDRIATLKREFIEEANTTLKKQVYLVGYQEVEGDNNLPNYAQLRMVALIDKIGIKKPDEDGGRILDRVLVTPQRAIELLNWGECGERAINEACKILQEKFGISANKFEDEWV